MTDRDQARQLVHDAASAPDFVRATFAGPARAGACPWRRVVVRPIEVRGERLLQFSQFDGRKDVTRNVPPTEATALLDELLAFGFAGMHLTTGREEIDIRTTKKDKIQIGRRKAQSAPPNVSHNRVKNLPLPEGKPDRLLEVMGVLTADGRVRPTMRAKYTQINEFLKLLTHVLDDAGLRSLGRPVEILDCGCGSSYLTLAVHHYLNDVLGVPARVMGVDVNEEVIRKSIERSQRCGADVRFAVGRIGVEEARPDLVLALHACDTATDDAIVLAVAAEARALLSVPCCHHYLNDQIASEPLRPLLRHGILRQRTADLVTDAFRALALRIVGYQTDVIEFISPEHTARNLMIRAVRGVPEGEAAFVREYLEMRRFWGVTPYLEKALGARMLHLLGDDR
jgi:hypothetical protein